MAWRRCGARSSADGAYGSLAVVAEPAQQALAGDADQGGGEQERLTPMSVRRGTALQGVVAVQGRQHQVARQGGAQGGLPPSPGRGSRRPG